MGNQRGLGPERVSQAKIKGREEGGWTQKRERRGGRLGGGSERSLGEPSAARRPVSLTAGNGAPARSTPAHRTRRGPPASSSSGPLDPRCPLICPAHLLTCLLLPAVLCHPASSLTLSKTNVGADPSGLLRDTHPSLEAAGSGDATRVSPRPHRAGDLSLTSPQNLLPFSPLHAGVFKTSRRTCGAGEWGKLVNGMRKGFIVV